jgi:plastocyanin
MQHARRKPQTLRGPAAGLLAALVLALIAVIALAGCGGSATTTAPPTTAPPTTGSVGSTSSSNASTAPTEATVVMKGSLFDPVTVTIRARGLVTWENQDATQHDVTADDGTFKSNLISKGGSFSFRFAKPGTYTYSCTVHPSMKGEVIVE